MRRDKQRLVYDVEVYGNFHCANFKDIISGEWHRFIIFADRVDKSRNINQVDDLLSFISGRCQKLIGYNSEDYDDMILMHLYVNSQRLRSASPELITQELKVWSNALISKQRTQEDSGKIYLMKKKQKPWTHLDLMKLFNRIDRASLKHLGIALKWPRIQDLPHPPEHIVQYHEVAEIVDYCDNDVNITEAVMNKLQKEINNRIDYTIKYGVNIMNDCDSSIGRSIIADRYIKATGISRKEFWKGRTFRTSIALKDCISSNIRFHTPEYNRILQMTRQAIIDPNKIDEDEKRKKKQFELTLRSKYLTHTMALGGVHSNNPPEILEENDEYMYWDIDAGSFYPYLNINERLHPAHMNPIIIDILQGVVDDRMKLKKTEPVGAYMLKIGANAYFGQTKSIYSPFYDPMVTTSTCILGQMYLFMLMEALEHFSKCVVVYSNTDGLTVKVPRKEEALFKRICDRWQQFVRFQLEFKQYRKMIIRDVNNYIMFTYSSDPDERIKAKGDYLPQDKKAIHKGYNYPVIAASVRDYFDLGRPVAESIMSCNSIYDFMKAERTNIDKFDVVLYPREGTATTLQKNNRWIVSRGNPQEGKLFKVDKQSRERTEMQKDFFVTPLNDVDESMHIDGYKINYDYYIQKATALVNLTQILDKDTHLQPEVKQMALSL